MDQLIDRRPRNHTKNKRKRVDILSTLDRKQIAEVKRAKQYRVDYDEDNDTSRYCR